MTRHGRPAIKLTSLPKAAAAYLEQLGARRLLWRTGWALKDRAGLLKAWSPPTPPAHAAPVSLRAWREASPWLQRATGPDRVLAVRRWAQSTLSPRALAALVKAAQAAAKSRPAGLSGQPTPITPDWRTDPDSGQRWPLCSPGHHSLRHAPHPAADIKLIWEPARFGHLQLMWRAWALSALPSAAAMFTAQLEDLLEANPPGLGPHWASGQEVAIRALNLLWAAAIMAEALDALPTGDYGAFILDALYLHAAFIADHLSYARYAVPNNHVIVEASALLLLCRACGASWSASRWQRVALSALDEALDAQFDEAGGYIQRSHSYHRLATQALSWLTLCLEPQELLLAKIERQCARSLEAALALLGLEGGQLPLWGPHDGAHLCRWSCCKDEDYRPWLQLLSAVAHHRPALEPGPWDEAALWLHGARALARKAAPHASPALTVGRQRAQQVVLREAPDCALIMTTRADGPFGQDDLGDVQLIEGGQRLTLDAGTYRYNGDVASHAWAHGAASHNTLTWRGGLGKRAPLGQFSWGSCARVEVLKLEATRCMWRATPAFIDAPAASSHEREVSRQPRGWRVEDRVVGVNQALTLHWLMPDWGWTIITCEADGVWLSAQAPDGRLGAWRMRLIASQGTQRHECVIKPRWWAPRYNLREPATSISFIVLPAPGERVVLVTQLERLCES